MARKENIFDNDIEVISMDLEDIEDRIVSNIKPLVLDDLPKIADSEEIKMDELPEITDAEEIKEEELPEITDVLSDEQEINVMEPEAALDEVVQTVTVADSEVEKAEEAKEVKASEPEKKESDNKADKDEKPAKKKKKSGADVVRKFLMAICVCILVYAGYNLTMIYMEYKVGEDEYEEIESYTTDEVATYNADYDLGDPFNPNFTPTQVDWQSLVSLNSDIYAWIEFENANLGINYPVAKGIDNLYYLEHTVNGTANSAGSIYIDCENDPYFHDTNTFIYGHNMKNGSMFGNLKKYRNDGFYAGNEYFWIYTPDSRSRYKIFSYYETAADSDTYKWWSDYCDEYTAYLENAKASSIHDTAVSINPDDKIITLSTCTSRDAYRFIVQAKLIYREFK